MSEKYLLDTNVFLTPYESYYAPDIVPSFWEALEDVFIPVSLEDSFLLGRG